MSPSPVAQAIRRDTAKTIWCFTGFLFENLLSHSSRRALLGQIDVLVDGPFVRSLRDTDLLFRGSSNQRLIDVPRSLKIGHAVLLDYNPFV